MDGNEEQRKRLGRSERRPENTDRTDDPVNPSGGTGSESRRREPDDYGSSRPYGENRDDRGDSGHGGREKGTIDKLIDQAQEKGYFDKAERFFRDKFGGGGRGGSSRR